jgi:hypothetical protein
LARLIHRAPHSAHAAGLVLCLLAASVAGAAFAPRPAGPPRAAAGVGGPVPGAASLAGAGHQVLVKRCFRCHAAGRMSGLDLRTRGAALAGGGRGPALLPGQPEKSSL